MLGPLSGEHGLTSSKTDQNAWRTEWKNLSDMQNFFVQHPVDAQRSNSWYFQGSGPMSEASISTTQVWLWECVTRRKAHHASIARMDNRTKLG